MNPRVRFEDEADDEYQNAGRWYEERRTGLGVEFFDAGPRQPDHAVVRITPPRLSGAPIYSWRSGSGVSSCFVGSGATSTS